ncbi:hypothetical protein BHM03_00006757 [Ensete ventricosum]|nr:hypothetical protein BHM03_00006757 [Ensete ventricosum]
MHRNINRLLFFNCDLFLILPDLLLHIFKRFNQQEAPLFAAMIMAPRFVTRPIKTLCRSKLQSTCPMIIFQPIVPLNRISFKVDYNDVYHRIIRSSIVAKIAFNA